MGNNYLKIFLVSASIIFTSCSELAKDSIPTEPIVLTHPQLFKQAEGHASYIRTINWEITSCRNCHSKNYSGGVSGSSCNTCHNKQNGPENCYTCHGDEKNSNFAPPKDLNKNINSTSIGVGAHQIHLSGTSNSNKINCNVCHKIPTVLYSENHLGEDSRAEVEVNSNSKFYTKNFAYNLSDGSCANTYCHGNMNNGNKENKIIWTADSTSVACGTCHGDKTKSSIALKALPKTTLTGGYHPDELNCSTCHDSVIDQNYKIINSQKHINGDVDFKK